MHGLLTELASARTPRPPATGAYSLCPAPAALGLLPGARRRRGAGPGAGTPQAGPDDGRVVEGGARFPGVHRLQPERPAQDGVRRVVGARPPGGAGVHAAGLGRRSTTSTPTSSPSPRCRPGWSRPATLAADDDDPQDLAPLLEVAARDQEAGLPDAPWPPVYPKQPGELSRVAPSRARKPDARPGMNAPFATALAGWKESGKNRLGWTLVPTRQTWTAPNPCASPPGGSTRWACPAT